MGIKERRIRERAERKKQIMNAARMLLLEKGLPQISIHQIAETAELGVGTIYFYYKSKEEIFASLQAEGLKILYEKISDITDTDSGSDEKLRQTGIAYLQFSQDHRNYFDIINYFLASPRIFFEPEVKVQIDRQGSLILEVISEIIEEGRRQQVFRDVDPANYAVLFWGALHGLVQFKKLKQTVLMGQSHQKLFEYAVDQLIQGLRQMESSMPCVIRGSQ